MSVLTLSQIEAQLSAAIESIRQAATPRVGSRSFAEFAEMEDGYPGIQDLFDGAVQSATKLWGSPMKLAHGQGSAFADVQGVPREFLNSRALRYAFWTTPNVQAAIAMLTHDADTLRSFELVLGVTTGEKHRS